MIAAAVIGLLVLVPLALCFLWRSKLRRGPARFAVRRPAQVSTQPAARFQSPKPPWVRREILRLKAWMPDAGCRTIAFTFNHLHERRRGTSGGKTYVASVLRSAGEEVMRLRRKLRRRKPRRFAKNVLWGLDWTYVPGTDSRSVAVLGVIDCGTRACLELAPVASRRTVTLLRQLLDLFERYGTPKVLRTDNDPACRSWLFRAVLRIVGVKHTPTAPFAPWQNGRIERLFGTVKRTLRWREGAGWPTPVSQDDLCLVRAWYNHLRPHQSLDGQTPAEAWNGKVLDLRRRPVWLCAWDGVLSGYLWPQ